MHQVGHDFRGLVELRLRWLGNVQATRQPNRDVRVAVAGVVVPQPFREGNAEERLALFGDPDVILRGGVALAALRRWLGTVVRGGYGIVA